MYVLFAIEEIVDMNHTSFRGDVGEDLSFYYIAENRCFHKNQQEIIQRSRR
jgi:hypothetical protein